MSMPKWEKQIVKALRPVIRQNEKLSPLASQVIWGMTDYLRVYPLILRIIKFRKSIDVQRYLVFMFSFFSSFVLYSDELDKFQAQVFLSKEEREQLRKKTHAEIVTFFQSLISEKEYYPFELKEDKAFVQTILLDFFQLEDTEENRDTVSIGFMTVVDGGVDTLVENLRQAKAKYGTQEFTRVMFES